MKLCTRCKINKPLEEFNYKVKAKNILSSHCRNCSKLYVQNHYLKNREYYLSKANKRNKALRKQIKEYIWDYFAKNHCIDCGESDPVVLEFDHIKDKLFTISSVGRNHTLEDVIKEIGKCEVRCANCHRRKTAKQFG